MSTTDPNVAGWDFAFKRPSTGDRFMIMVGVSDRDAALAVALNASPHVDEDELIGETVVTTDLLARFDVPLGGWQQTI